MRVTQRMMTSGTLNRLNQRLAVFEDTQIKLGSGKRIQVPSDDVAGMGTALRLRSEMAARTQEQRNIEDGMRWVDLADSELQNVVSQLQRARELAVRGANASSPSERAAIQQEIVAVQESIVASANATSQGRRLFGGFTGGEAVAQLAGTWTYVGDSGAIKRRTSESELVQINVTGDDIFGFNAGQNIFDILDDLSASLIAGDSPAISASIGAIDAGMANVLDGLATVGAAGNRLEAALDRVQASQHTVRSYLSEVEDVDMAEAMTELQLQEVSYQATLAALSKALQPSLTDFLR